MTRTAAAPPEPVIWTRAEVRAHGRRPTYSRSQIAEAAVRIADTEGLEAVSMQRVSAAIGAGTMSLYRYVRSKEELRALMLEEVMPAPPNRRRPWRDGLRWMALGVRRLVRRHPWYGEVAAEVTLPGPRGLRIIEHLLSSLTEAGFNDASAAEAVYSVMLLATASAHNELAETRAAQRAGLTQAQWRARQGHYLEYLARQGKTPIFCRLASRAELGAGANDALFATLLDRLLDSLHAGAARQDA